VSLVAALASLAAYVAFRAFTAGPPGHAHEHGPHGGVVASLGHDRPHYHAELVLDAEGVLHLYPLGQDAEQALEVEPQPLQAEVRVAGHTDVTSVILRPDWSGGAAEARVSAFIGRLRRNLLGTDLDVRFPGISINGARFPAEFDWKSDAGGVGLREEAFREEDRLYRTPGGWYTEADIDADGRTTPSEKFKEVQPVHDLSPAVGDRLCPVTGIKASPAFHWVVGGGKYLFCCVPCIDDFVTAAKRGGDRLKPPEAFVKAN
jgi:hypothetical protein